jgi:hypothetical protein
VRLQIKGGMQPRPRGEHLDESPTNTRGARIKIATLPRLAMLDCADRDYATCLDADRPRSIAQSEVYYPVPGLGK